VPTELKILDLDLENRPLSYLGSDYTTAEITALACCWVSKPKSIKVWLLGRDSMVEMLKGFVEYYDQADMVTGHYIRMHDLPILNGAMIENGLPPLAEKLTCDTKLDLVKKGQVFSASQENLSEMFGLRYPKVQMTTPKWREANRLTPEGLKLTERRVAGDVLQHMALRHALVERGLLSEPKAWRP
jgi:hypothetical protein